MKVFNLFCRYLYLFTRVSFLVTEMFLSSTILNLSVEMSSRSFSKFMFSDLLTNQDGFLIIVLILEFDEVDSSIDNDDKDVAICK